MQNLKVINQNGQFVTDSLNVSELTGKRHDHLLRDIDGYIYVLNKSTAPKIGVSEFFIPSTYQDSTGRILPCYLITRKGCDMVANKMTGEKGVIFTAAYVTKFEEMEKSIKSISSLVALQQTVKVLGEHEDRLNQLDEKVDNQITITYNQAKEVQFAVKRRVVDLLGGKDTSSYKKHKGSYFKQLYNDLYNRLGVPSYRDTKKIDFNNAIAYIKAWLPKAEDRQA